MKNNGKGLDIKETALGGVDKVSRYKWTIKNKPGEFHFIKKEDLYVDHAYQRSRVNLRRVEDIARSWDWIACGVLIVSLREDNKWWVIDGQHRKLGADKRSDIRALPCMVFEGETRRDEAMGFLAINTGKVGVGGLDRFRAMVVAGDKHATGLAAVLTSTGHKAGITGSSKTVACIITLLRLYRDDVERFKKLWPLLADMHPNSPVVDAVAKGIWQIDKWLRKENRNASDTPYRERLLSLGGEAAAALVRQETVLMGHGSVRVAGVAMAKWINKQRLPAGFKINFQ